MLRIDLENREVVVEADGGREAHPFASAEAFRLISKAWLRCAWEVKHPYTFTWMGRPVIQNPEDMIRLQEVIYSVKPDVVVETGVAHGGSSVFYASLLKAMGHGRVISVELDLRPHNRKALDEHYLRPLITLVEGSSIDPEVARKVKALIEPDERVLVGLDSNHTKAHVLAELETYAALVPVGSYLIAMDGIMEDLVGAPRSEEDWSWNNPKAAAQEFVDTHDDFVIEEPPFVFNESMIEEWVTHWPSAFVKRIR